jgi:MFS family permease
VCFAAFARHELRREQPLIELRFFRSAPFAGASAIAILAFAAMGGFLLLNTLYLQDVRGLSPLDAGLYMLPMAGMLVVFSPLSGRLVGRVGSRPSLLLAASALIVSALMLTRLTPTTSVGYLLASYFLAGIGLGFVNPPITNTAVSGMPPSQAGVASAIASTSRQVGMTLGVAVIGAIAAGGLAGSVGRGFATATHPAWWTIAGFGAGILLLGGLTTSRWANETAERTASRFRERPSELAAA